MFTEVEERRKTRLVVAKAQRDILKKEAKQAAEAACESMLHEANEQAELAYSKQVQIDRRARELLREAELFAQQSERWARIYKEFNDVVKEVGDVKDWARAIEEDLSAAMEALKEFHRKRSERKAQSSM
jgi:hypothetical protein